jgi:hypothetical protein
MSSTFLMKDEGRTPSVNLCSAELNSAKTETSFLGSGISNDPCCALFGTPAVGGMKRKVRFS